MSSYQITPITEFYIAESSFQAGVIVDFQSVSKTAAVINFSSGEGLGKFTAIVTHNNNGTFSVKYATSAQAAEVLGQLANNSLVPSFASGSTPSWAMLSELEKKLYAVRFFFLWHT
jgi:hypothetical protein